MGEKGGAGAFSNRLALWIPFVSFAFSLVSIPGALDFLVVSSRDCGNPATPAASLILRSCCAAPSALVSG